MSCPASLGDISEEAAEELEALKAIYGEEEVYLHPTKCSTLCVQMNRLLEEGKPRDKPLNEAQKCMHISLTPGYPNKEGAAPKLSPSITQWKIYPPRVGYSPCSRLFLQDYEDSFCGFLLSELYGAFPVEFNSQSLLKNLEASYEKGQVCIFNYVERFRDEYKNFLSASISPQPEIQDPQDYWEGAYFESSNSDDESFMPSSSSDDDDSSYEEDDHECYFKDTNASRNIGSGRNDISRHSLELGVSLPRPLANSCLSMPKIIHGGEILDRKSVFQGHLAIVESLEQVFLVRKSLLENSKIARATHNILAYRVRIPSRKLAQEEEVTSANTPGLKSKSLKGFEIKETASSRSAEKSTGGQDELSKDYVLHEDHDSDGESSAGRNLQNLLSLLKVNNVVVIVSRWYGGIHLGPDRFKRINSAAREVLELGGLCPASSQQRGGEKLAGKNSKRPSTTGFNAGSAKGKGEKKSL